MRDAQYPGLACLLPDIRDGRVIRHRLASQPHKLDVATGPALWPVARRDAVQPAGDEQLARHRWVIARSPGPRGDRTGEAEARTRLASLIQSSSRSGKSTLWPRSTPACGSTRFWSQCWCALGKRQALPGSGALSGALWLADAPPLRHAVGLGKRRQRRGGIKDGRCFEIRRDRCPTGFLPLGPHGGARHALAVTRDRARTPSDGSNASVPGEPPRSWTEKGRAAQWIGFAEAALPFAAGHAAEHLSKRAALVEEMPVAPAAAGVYVLA